LLIGDIKIKNHKGDEIMNIKAMAENLEMESGEFMDLLGYFVEKSASDVERLEAAVKAGDLREIVEASHSIKGAAGNLGFMNIYEIAKEIEANGRENNLDCEAAVRALKEALDVVGNTVKYGD
jgi:HPt (histidine-containing phosphotransfer) domain-containing protein